MSEMMTFPDTWEEYEKFYGFADKEKVYSNGSRLIHSFRVEQWLDHLERKRGEWALNDDQVYECKDCGYVPSFDGYTYFNYCPNCGADMREGREDDDDN